jgi:hypothetical protein
VPIITEEILYIYICFEWLQVIKDYFGTRILRPTELVNTCDRADDLAFKKESWLVADDISGTWITSQDVFAVEESY